MKLDEMMLFRFETLVEEVKKEIMKIQNKNYYVKSQSDQTLFIEFDKNKDVFVQFYLTENNTGITMFLTSKELDLNYKEVYMWSEDSHNIVVDINKQLLKKSNKTSSIDYSKQLMRIAKEIDDMDIGNEFVKFIKRGNQKFKKFKNLTIVATPADVEMKYLDENNKSQKTYINFFKQNDVLRVELNGSIEKKEKFKLDGLFEGNDNVVFSVLFM